MIAWRIGASLPGLLGPFVRGRSQHPIQGLLEGCEGMGPMRIRPFRRNAGVPVAPRARPRIVSASTCLAYFLESQQALNTPPSSLRSPAYCFNRADVNAKGEVFLKRLS